MAKPSLGGILNVPVVSKDLLPKNSDFSFLGDSQDTDKKTGEALLYSIENNLNNWYQALPYGFRNKQKDGTIRAMFLPISPSNIQVVTHFATNIIPTLYGTVEEHSETRYFDITISGTTGFSPRYVRPIDFIDPYSSRADPDVNRTMYEYSKLDTNRRESFAVHEPILNGFGNFLGPTINKVTSVVNKTLQTAETATDTFGLTKSKEPETGVRPDSTGYVAFHNLYRFFLSYKNDASGIAAKEDADIKAHPLQFLNYKDNIQYDVAIRTFTLTRNSENPMLYNYSITLRGYNLRSLFDDSALRNDDALEQRLAALGLSSVRSSGPFNAMKNVSNGIKSTVGALKGLGELF